MKVLIDASHVVFAKVCLCVPRTFNDCTGVLKLKQGGLRSPVINRFKFILVVLFNPKMTERCCNFFTKNIYIILYK